MNRWPHLESKLYHISLNMEMSSIMLVIMTSVSYMVDLQFVRHGDYPFAPVQPHPRLKHAPALISGLRPPFRRIKQAFPKAVCDACRNLPTLGQRLDCEKILCCWSWSCQIRQYSRTKQALRRVWD